MNAPSILQPGTYDHYSVTEHGITFIPETSRDQWLVAIQRLCGMYEGVELTKQRTLMLLADALNWGQDAFGEEFAQAIDNTRASLGLSPKTIANAQAVYKRIEVSRRREGITLGHYSVIAALEVGEQDRYVEQILTNKMTIGTLKEIVAAEHPKTKRGKDRKSGIVADMNGVRAELIIEETEASALQKLEDVLEWIEGNGISEKWKLGLEAVYKIFRRKWQTGKRR